jgi:hypothetical protein
MLLLLLQVLWVSLHYSCLCAARGTHGELLAMAVLNAVVVMMLCMRVPTCTS